MNKNTEISDLLSDLSKRSLKEIDISNGSEIEICQNIKCLIEQISWNLHSNNIDPKNNDLVVISYELSSKSICLKLKEKLELSSYNTWMDLNDTIYSNLDSTLKKIEQSLCFIICLTEKYRQSIVCQIQAQYAFKLNKKIICLQMQNGYRNAMGWLGTIIGNNRCIDFNELEFDQQVETLLLELSPPMVKETTKEQTAMSMLYMSTTNNSLILEDTINGYCLADEWNETEVKNWFTRSNLKPIIFEYLKPCSGKMLKQMRQMKFNAPEFYYHSLKEIKDLKFNDILLFSMCLDELFSTKSQI